MKDTRSLDQKTSPWHPKGSVSSVPAYDANAYELDDASTLDTAMNMTSSYLVAELAKSGSFRQFNLRTEQINRIEGLAFDALRALAKENGESVTRTRLRYARARIALDYGPVHGQKFDSSPPFPIVRHVKYPEFSDRDTENDSDLVGNYFEFEREEYLQVEYDALGSSYLWSSTKALLEVIERLEHAFDSIGRSEGGSLSLRGGYSKDVAAADLLSHLTGAPDAIDVVIVDFPGVSFGWRRPRVKMEWGTREYCEVSVTGLDLDFESVTRLVNSTASPIVAQYMSSPSDLIGILDAA